jgi:PhnB protein
MQVQPYLFFAGRCEEALGFYRDALGAEVTALMRYRESPDPCPAEFAPPGSEDRIMHASFRVGDTEVLAADDCSPAASASFKGFSLTLSVADDAEAGRVFARLADGGQVTMPLGKTFFSPCFGMLSDRFGVGWMVIVLPPA